MWWRPCGLGRVLQRILDITIALVGKLDWKRRQWLKRRWRIDISIGVLGWDVVLYQVIDGVISSTGTCSSPFKCTLLGIQTLILRHFQRMRSSSHQRVIWTWVERRAANFATVAVWHRADQSVFVIRAKT